MDEIETVNRRDAVTGLGVLCVLMLGLFGTIFFRIIDPRPAEKISVNDLALAPAIATEASMTYQLPAAVEEAWPRQDGGVQAASFTEAPTSPSTPMTSPPNFIAPGER